MRLAPAADPRGGRRGLALRLAFGLALLDRQAADARRARIPGAGAAAWRAGQGFVYDRPRAEPAPRSSSAARPAIPLFLALDRRRRDDVDATPARVRSRSRSSARVGVWLIGADRAAAGGTARRRRRRGDAAASIRRWCGFRAYVLSEALYCTIALGAVVLLELRARSRGRPARPPRAARVGLRSRAALRPALPSWSGRRCCSSCRSPALWLVVAAAIRARGRSCCARRARRRALDGAQLPRLRSVRARRVRRRRDVLDRQPSARAAAKATWPPTPTSSVAELDVPRARIRV